MKCCSVCKVEKPLSDFRKRAASRDGLTSECRSCHCGQVRASLAKAGPSVIAARQAAWYTKNKQRKREYNRAWIAANSDWVLERSRIERWKTRWAQRLVTHTRGAAKSRGREFSLTKSDIESMYERQGGKCYWLGIPFAFEIEPRHPQRPSIDRLDPSRGYTPDNVVLACQFANMGRSTLGAERFAQFLESTGLRERVDRKLSDL